MKKLLIMLVVSCLMMVCSVGLAANDHKDLAKQQQAVERMLDVFNGYKTAGYFSLSFCVLFNGVFGYEWIAGNAQKSNLEATGALSICGVLGCSGRLAGAICFGFP